MWGLGGMTGWQSGSDFPGSANSQEGPLWRTERDESSGTWGRRLLGLVQTGPWVHGSESGLVTDKPGGTGCPV